MTYWHEIYSSIYDCVIVETYTSFLNLMIKDWPCSCVCGGLIRVLPLKVNWFWVVLWSTKIIKERNKTKIETEMEVLTVHSDVLKQIWKPDLFFSNEKDAATHKIVTENALIRYFISEKRPYLIVSQYYFPCRKKIWMYLIFIAWNNYSSFWLTPAWEILP